MDGTPKKRAAKVGHRKSRNGCTRCKIRRVKCNEVRPVCSHCQRLGLDCAWPENQPTATPFYTSPYAHTRSQSHSYHSPSSGGGASLSNLSTASTEFGENSSGGGDGHSPNEQDAQRFSAMLQTWSQNVKHEATSSQAAPPPPTSNLALLLDGSGVTASDTRSAIATEAESEGLMPESRERRMLEVHLMENYIANLGMPFPGAPADWSEIWHKKVPPMARRYDNVLFAVMSHSATHLLRQEPRNHYLFRARQAYLVAAMRVQRRMIGTLTLDSADAVCISALFMLSQAFAMLDERNIEPYTTPMDWLRLGNGAGAVIWMSVEAMTRAHEPDKSVMYKIATAEPRMGFDESYFDASNREQFKDLLSQDLPSGDDWDDADTRDAYEKTLSYVGCLQLAKDRGEPIHIISRRMQGFTMVMPPRFVDFVAERRPRALVILAHFFAVVSRFTGGAWWLGGEDGKPPIATRELRGLQQIIPPEWMPHMVWPMRTAGLWPRE
ncbi:hypothetical protein SCUCBS95973_006207 [Sporothrix curviconia]|uniref:Zn(2)-C6 fungal-type domain-containing protein n=1 Tax=Sporothrix curviconia TaxID=1260050 RepID=A0ABP0C5F3_9PEZI